MHALPSAAADGGARAPRGDDAPRPPRLFIAHAPEDAAFVDGFLLPALALPTADVLLSSRLSLGEGIVDELSRGALGTITLLVLSPAFFQCPWTRFAEQLAQHHGVEAEETAGVIPILLAACEVPLATRFRVSLDFRDPDRAQWEDQIARLRARLAEPAPASASPARRPRGSDPSALLTPDATPCPYPGMRSFTAEEVAAFHGRRAEIEELLARLRAGERELYVIGPSGSGKSSLVFAGLVPSLRQRPSPAGACFAVRTMRPGADPLAALAFASSVAPQPGCDRTLLVVDQLEELFSIAAPPARAAFFAAVRQLRRDPDLVLIFTLRADFYGALIDCPWWTDLDGRLSRIDIGPLRGAALRTAIEAPAAAARVFFEPALLERLLADSADEPGTLPLLQETLVVLWQQRARNFLRLADYLAIGNDVHTGLAVTLARRADSALRALDPKRRAIARRIFLRLVQFGSGRADTRRQQPRAALHSAAASPVEVDAVLAHLVEHRLITAAEVHGPGAVFDLSHEILLSAWPTLREWISAQRVDEQRRRMLETKAEEWVASGGGVGGLLDGTQLDELDRWLDAARDVQLGPHARTLIVRSRRRRLVLRWFAGVALIVLVLGLIAIAILLVIARRSAHAAQHNLTTATEQRKLADDRLAESYQESARKLLVEDRRPLQALPYLIEARRIGGVSAPLRMLFHAAAASAPLTPALEHTDAVTSAQFSLDGNRLVTSSLDGTARLWEVATGKPLGPPLVHGAALAGAALSPDGKRIVTAGEDGLARLWDAATGRALGPRFGHRASLTAAVFSPDGTRLLTASKDHTACLWDLSSGEKLLTLRHRSWIRAVAFSPDGARIVTASLDHTARVWNAETGQPVTGKLVHEGSVRAASFSPSGARVVTASDDGTARIWNAETGQRTGRPLEHEGIVERAVFSPSGSRIVTASWDRTARVWNAETGEPITEPLKHRGIVWSAAFSPDGARIATASDDDTAQVWDAETGEPAVPPLEHQAPVRAALFRSDGSTLATASDDGTARLWNAVVSRQPCAPLEHGTPVELAAFSPDGERLLTVAEDDTARVWDPVTCAPVTPPLHHPGLTSASFSADGTRVLTRGTVGGGERQWDAGSGAALEVPAPPRSAQEIPPAATAAASSIEARSPDGSRRLTTATNGAPNGAPNGGERLARLLDATTGLPLTPPLEHLGPIRAASFSPDGARVVTASDDHTALVWDATTGQRLAPALVHDGPLRSASFSPGGDLLVTTSADGTARLWDTALDPGSLEQWERLARRGPYQLLRGVLVLRARGR